MNPVIELILEKYHITPAEFFGSSPAYAMARKEAIQTLGRAGIKPKRIAWICQCHVQTVYYWLRPKRREAMITKRFTAWRDRGIGGPKQTKKQRDEILRAYLEDPAKGTALAVSRGLAPLYAYKLANMMGAIPSKNELRSSPGIQRIAP